MAPLCSSPVMPLALWRRRDSANSAPLARVSISLPDGAQLERELRINYNMTEVRALLADEIQFDPDQLDIYCDSCVEPVPDSLVLAGLGVEHRDLTLHLQLKAPVAPVADVAALAIADAVDPADCADCAAEAESLAIAAAAAATADDSADSDEAESLPTAPARAESSPAAPVEAACAPETPSEPAVRPSKPAKSRDDSHPAFARRLFEWGARRRCSLRRR